MDRLEGKMDGILTALEELGEKDQGISKVPRSPSVQKDADGVVTPLEGLSLELIEARYAGAGGWAVVTGSKTRDED
jgi:hypothetical protein